MRRHIFTVAKLQVTNAENWEWHVEHVFITVTLRDTQPLTRLLFPMWRWAP